MKRFHISPQTGLAIEASDGQWVRAIDAVAEAGNIRQVYTDEINLQQKVIARLATQQHLEKDFQDELVMPTMLHTETQLLVKQFAWAMAVKLRRAEQKHGYTDEWKNPAVVADLKKALYEHLEKGDPIDVANYCAFLFHHRVSTEDH